MAACAAKRSVSAAIRCWAGFVNVTTKGTRGYKSNGTTSGPSVRLSSGIEDVECNGEAAHGNEVHPADLGEVLEEKD